MEVMIASFSHFSHLFPDNTRSGDQQNHSAKTRHCSPTCVDAAHRRATAASRGLHHTGNFTLQSRIGGRRNISRYG
jgi:hypothetical protein